MWGGDGSEQVAIVEAPDSGVAVLAHCHHDSFFLMHVQGQVGILIHVTFVLPQTLSGPQVPQLDLWEEAQGAVTGSPAGTHMNPRPRGQGHTPRALQIRKI